MEIIVHGFFLGFNCFQPLSAQGTLICFEFLNLSTILYQHEVSYFGRGIKDKQLYVVFSFETGVKISLLLKIFRRAFQKIF